MLGVLVLINVSWQVGLVGFANIARGRLVQAAVQRTIGRITGAVLIGFRGVAYARLASA